MLLPSLLASLLPLLLLAGPAFAGADALADADTDSEGEDTGGWGDDGTGEDSGEGTQDQAGFGASAPVASEQSAKPPGPVSFGGSLASQEAVWLEARNSSALAKVRQSVDLWLGLHVGSVRARVSGHGELDLAYLLKPDDWQPATIDVYEHQVALREAWLSVTTGPLDTTLGRQVVSWGEGRVLSVVDVVSPRDLREPGMVDLADLRLPVTMARLSLGLQSDKFWAGSHRFEAMVVPEADFGYRSPPTGPYGSLPGVIADQDLAYNINGIDDFEGLINGADISYHHLQSRWDVKQLQAFGRWSWRGRGVDLALMGGSLLHQQGVLALPDLLDLLTAANLDEAISVDLDHRRYGLLGHSGTAQTPWLLLRWELAWKHQLPVNVGTIIDYSQGFAPVFDVRTEQPDLLQGMLGLSWSGWKGTTVDVDLLQGYLPKPPQDLIFPVDSSAWALRLNKPVLRQRMAIEGLVTGWGWLAQSGWAARGGVSYQIMDGLATSAQVITYHPGRERGPILGLSTHDRAQLGLRWDF